MGGFMYKIGEFSGLTGASVKTLRYYDQIDLLKPSSIDNFTNYRYYSDSEVQRYKRILYLKEIGFTLEEIKNNIDNLTIETIDLKKQELIKKRDLIISQIMELDSLKNGISHNKVKTLK